MIYSVQEHVRKNITYIQVSYLQSKSINFHIIKIHQLNVFIKLNFAVFFLSLLSVIFRRPVLNSTISYFSGLSILNLEYPFSHLFSSMNVETKFCTLHVYHHIFPIIFFSSSVEFCFIGCFGFVYRKIFWISKYWYNESSFF